MNERFESISPIEPWLIDRLVDGELTDAEELALLAALEIQPDGWRRCALAFLEARTWKNELAAVTSAAVTSAAVTPAAVTPAAVMRRDSARVNGAPVVLSSPAADHTSAEVPRVSATSGQWTRAFTIAASIGLAFALGIVARGYWVTSDRPMHGQLAANADEHGVGTSGMAASGTSRTNPGDTQPTVTMTLMDNRGDIERQLEIPVVEADSLDPRFFKRPPSAIPQNLVSALRRSGYTVEEQRLFVPVVLDDGRQAIIPLDQAEVRFHAAHY